MKNTVYSLEELKQLRQPIKNANTLHQERLSPVDKLAVWVTKHIGTMGFFAIIFLWTVIWLTWNTLGPPSARFDPYPGFVLWLFISNMIQIFLMPLIMIGQNLDARHSEARAESAFEVNVKDEREVETILMHLENQNQLISQILAKLEQLDQEPHATSSVSPDPAGSDQISANQLEQDRPQPA
jgi:uncharacterized membrane protein